jgi:hypothetical protein
MMLPVEDQPGRELRRLEQAILTQDPAVDHPSPPPPGPIHPPVEPVPTWYGPRSHLTSIVGHDRQLAELTHLLTDHRLVTVIGTGGVGKTTLALHAAETVVADHPVAVAALASSRSEDDIALELGRRARCHRRQRGRAVRGAGAAGGAAAGATGPRQLRAYRRAVWQGRLPAPVSQPSPVT